LAIIANKALVAATKQSPSVAMISPNRLQTQVKNQARQNRTEGTCAFLFLGDGTKMSQDMPSGEFLSSAIRLIAKGMGV
jgi:hypothetical protein